MPGVRASPEDATHRRPMTTTWIQSGSNAVEIRTNGARVHAASYSNVRASDPAKCSVKVPGAVWDGGREGARKWAFEMVGKR